jgi:dihydrodipicolinate synthase/N-acetylneuraminate lyase
MAGPPSTLRSFPGRIGDKPSPVVAVGTMRGVLKGAMAAAVTPLDDDGRRLDEAAFGPLVRFLADGGIDGVLACGTTGEGILLTPDERRRVTELFLRARPDGFQVAVHAGAQTTAETVELASHARSVGADAVAVIGPPYFPLDEEEILAHLRAAADACVPLPFYVYEFAARSGYAIPVEVLVRLREVAPNLAGLKVSDTPWSAVEPYLLPGLDLFVGSEPLALDGLANGAAGAVSALASAFPDVVAALVHERSPQAHEAVATLRRDHGGRPLIAAL